MQTAQAKCQAAKPVIFALAIELAKKWVVTAGVPLSDLDVAAACARGLAA